MRLPIAIQIEVIPHRLPRNLVDLAIELTLLPMALVPGILFF